MPTIATNYNYMTLAILKEIKANQYRSKDASRDYYPELIEEAILSKLDKRDRQASKKREVEEVQQFEELGDDLRSFLMALNSQGSQFLSSETLKLIVRDLAPHVADYK